MIDDWMSTAVELVKPTCGHGHTRGRRQRFCVKSGPQIPDLAAVEVEVAVARSGWHQVVENRPVVSRSSVLKDLCIDEAREAMMRVASVSPSCRPLPRRRLSEPFETLAGRVAQELPGVQAWVVSVGEGAVVSARRDFAANALAAAGVEPARVAYGAWSGASDGDHARETIRRFAVLCAEDTELDASLPRRVEELRLAGVQRVARGATRGASGEDALDGFLHRGFDLVSGLSDLFFGPGGGEALR